MCPGSQQLDCLCRCGSHQYNILSAQQKFSLPNLPYFSTSGLPPQYLFLLTCQCDRFLVPMVMEARVWMQGFANHGGTIPSRVGCQMWKPLDDQGTQLTTIFSSAGVYIYPKPDPWKSTPKKYQCTVPKPYMYIVHYSVFNCPVIY